MDNRLYAATIVTVTTTPFPWLCPVEVSCSICLRAIVITNGLFSDFTLVADSINGGDNDNITIADQSHAVVIMGDGDDILTLNATNVVACGDHCRVTSTGDLLEVMATPSTSDGNDEMFIQVNQLISNTMVIGGGGYDTLITNNAAHTILIGDYGDITAQSSVIVTSTHVDDDAGNRDFLQATVPPNGRAIMIGGTGNDNISVNTPHAGDIVACGDHCNGMLDYLHIHEDMCGCMTPCVISLK
jgi:hypothetical protein